MTVSGRKKFFLVAGVLCTLFLPFIVLLLLSQKNRIHYTALKLLHRQDPNYTIDTTQFLFSSALPEIVIDTSPPNLVLLSFLLNKLSLLPFENLPYVLSTATGIDKITPHTVEVVFYPITDLPKEDPSILQIVTNPNGSYRVAFAAGRVDRMKHYVTIPVYVDIHDPFFSRDPVYTLNVSALVGIFYTFHTPPLAPPDGTDPYMKFKNKVGDGFLPDMIFQARVHKTSRVPSLLSSLLSLVAKKTHAACLGTGQCGTLVNTHTCSSGPYAGQSCYIESRPVGGSPCPGFCEATTICQPNGQTVSCSTGSLGCRPYACGSCIVSHSCMETSNDCSRDSDLQCVGKYDCSGECVPPGGGSGRCRMSSTTGSDGKRICSCDSNYCSSQLPTPTPRPTTRPGGGGGSTPPPSLPSCTQGDCFPGISNCGQVGRENGSGSCPGGLCCRPLSPPPGCPYSPNDPPGCTVEGENRLYNNGVPTRGPCCNGLAEDENGTCGCPQPCPTFTVYPPQPQTCVSSTNQTASVRFSWQRVDIHHEYQVAIFNQNNVAVYVSPWQHYGRYSCPSSQFPCNYTHQLPKGQYRVEISARGANCRGVASQSQQVNILDCPGTFRARARRVSLADANNCSAPSSPLSSSLRFSPNLPTQSSDGTTYASWSTPPGTYTLIPTITESNSQSFVLQTACVSRNGSPPSSSTLAQSIQNNDLVTYDLLYTLGEAWMRVTGGNVIACRDVVSIVQPSSPYFILNGSGGSPGVLSYGASFSFADSRINGAGIDRISATRWVVQNAFPKVCNTTETNFYEFFAQKFDIAGIQSLPFPGGIKTKTDFPQNVSRVVGNLILGGSPQDWSLSTQEKKTIFVDGNVTIQQNISYPDGGFFGLIVNGNITIAPTVGSPHTSSTPSLRGFFATSPAGRFITGQSSTQGREKLVVLGTVAAGGFTLQRNLESLGVNHTTPAEEFLYDPHLLLSLPDKFKDLKIKWQEVPP